MGYIMTKENENNLIQRWFQSNETNERKHNLQNQMEKM